MSGEPIGLREIREEFGREVAAAVDEYLGPLARCRVEVYHYADAGADDFDGPVIVTLAGAGWFVWATTPYSASAATVHARMPEPGGLPIESAQDFARAIELVADIVAGRLSPLGDVFPDEG